MRKRTYFDTHDGEGWPDPKWLEPYFLTATGRARAFATDNDSWGIKVHGIDGTEHLDPYRGRIDIDLTILGSPSFGVLLFYHKSGGRFREGYYSKGNSSQLYEWMRTAHGDRMSVGFFIPFDSAWRAIKEFIETDGALPQSINWWNQKDIPSGVFQQS